VNVLGFVIFRASFIDQTSCLINAFCSVPSWTDLLIVLFEKIETVTNALVTNIRVVGLYSVLFQCHVSTGIRVSTGEVATVVGGAVVTGIVVVVVVVAGTVVVVVAGGTVVRGAVVGGAVVGGVVIVGEPPVVPLLLSFGLTTTEPNEALVYVDILETPAAANIADVIPAISSAVKASGGEPPPS
jgi:hypothetical protein